LSAGFSTEDRPSTFFAQHEHDYEQGAFCAERMRQQVFRQQTHNSFACLTAINSYIPPLLFSCIVNEAVIKCRGVKREKDECFELAATACPSDGAFAF
jgi:hypothetical protein